MFRTNIEIKPSAYTIDYQSKLLMMGSCFSENMGNKLTDCYFNVDVNPFGTLFNPISIQKGLERLLSNKDFLEEELVLSGELWSSFAHSNLFAHTDPKIALNTINGRFKSAAEQFQSLDYLSITFGTAWVYDLKTTQQVVANCHKLPANHFIRRRLTAEKIVEIYAALLDKLWQINSNLVIIFSVSPVRHFKDGATENNISKGILLQAVQALAQKHERVDYFPSYEILVDELRDYRFYANDMLHPSTVAIDYIFEKFSACFFSKNTTLLLKELYAYRTSILHRPIHPTTQESQNFREALNEKRLSLESQYPFLVGRLEQPILLIK
ncbi:MAG: hypothetical protein AUK44_02555 [Porphyromonadaceae bacterium CG2_30_38_12]|nr:MAG: hypothetical protein AUK44_02555 [Porphyromonadaceae bacterium CG2_30_38_12]